MCTLLLTSHILLHTQHVQLQSTRNIHSYCTDVCALFRTPELCKHIVYSTYMYIALYPGFYRLQYEKQEGLGDFKMFMSR